MQTHFPIDIVDDVLTLPQSPDPIAKNSEPLHLLTASFFASSLSSTASSLCAFCAFLWLTFLCALCGLPYLRNRETQPIPARFLGLKLLSPGARQLVKLRFTTSLVYVPTRRHPTFLLNPVERGIQRSLLHIQHFVGKLANALNDPVPMQLPERERLQYQHIERPL